jgi:hypothetical protein
MQMQIKKRTDAYVSYVEKLRRRFEPLFGQVGFVVEKCCWCMFSPSTSVSSANLRSTKFSIIIITRGRYNRPCSGRPAEWTQLGLHPPLCELKKMTRRNCRFQT